MVALKRCSGARMPCSICPFRPVVRAAVLQRPYAHGTSAEDAGRRVIIASFMLACTVCISKPARADSSVADLPTDFISLERKLIQTLRESILLQQDGGSESEVRKSADSAKGPIKEFLGKWKNDQRVEGTIVWLETAKAIEELGQYYIRRGQRAALDKSTAASILTHLDAAESVLPPEEEKKFLGIF